MTSSKHRTTSKSGGSRKSTSKAASRKAANTLQSAPHSFEEIFGKAPTAEAARLADLLKRARRHQQELDAEPVPALALYRTRLRAKQYKAAVRVQQLQEALEAETGRPVDLSEATAVTVDQLRKAAKSSN